MPHDPIAARNSMIGRAKRKRDALACALSDAADDLDGALYALRQLPDSPERNAAYAVIENRRHKIRELLER